MLTAADIDSQSLTYSIVTNGTKGIASITNAATGAVSFPVKQTVRSETAPLMMASAEM
jgi:hypothetical protein